MAAIKNSMRSVAFSANPVLALRLPVWRSRVLLLLLCVSFVVLLGRAFYLQTWSNDFLQKQGENRYARTLELPATRGKVLDRNGTVLASSLPVKAIWAIPEDVDADRTQLRELAKLLGVKESDLRKKFADEDRSFVYLKRQVGNDIADEIKKMRLAGIYDRKEYKRFYPEGETLAHVLGFTNVEDKGQEGLELAFEKELAGKVGSRRVIKDRMGRVVEDLGATRTPHDGKDLTLAIDTKIQFLAFSKLKEAVEQHRAKAGAAVVLDARTGEILALANWPSYNPNQRDKLSGEQLRNRVLTDSFEPGSVMKPFIAAMALEAGYAKPNTIIQTAPGRLTIGTATIGDAHPHDALTVEEVIQKSSNVGTVKLALQSSPQHMWELFTQLGFGQAPRIGFPGAVAGRVRPYKNWKPIEQATMSYGHGVSVSLLQMARAYTAFANEGELLPLSLLKRDGAAGQAISGARVFSPSTAQAVRHMLEMAAGPGGTAPKAQVMGYRVAGKTGTAHKLGSQGYENRYVASFVGLAPVSAPRLIVAVMIDEPSAGKYFGGEVAAPVFANIVSGALRALQVNPDAPFKTLVVPEEIPEERT